MDPLAAIREEWSWAIPTPQRILETNAFGNVLVVDSAGAVWRICPEELACEQVARDVAALSALHESPDFAEDWRMANLVEVAQASHGPQEPGRCFCLKVPAVLGGSYSADNIGTIGLAELLSFAGNAARQIKDLPEGTQVQFRWDA